MTMSTSQLQNLIDMQTSDHDNDTDHDNPVIQP
eukprot:CAMPEP_0114673202 /NCGR_PEP_ID=MMETSP0191-20121206/44272_1 /TAXON_ID=126664 /ORGANISM="Sorites sp." /LENGTH=32 /DNA_ID= /DNA_START= /DNA_END= /DNA_ORIENTATION=